MKNALIRLIPELALIQDEELRRKTVDVWIDAVEKGGWRIEDLSLMPFTLLIKNVPVSIIDHTRAVTLCSVGIADVLAERHRGLISINKDYLLSGALLHDVGKLLEYKKEKETFVKSRDGELLRHPVSGAVLAAQHGIPREVVHIIAAHSKEGDGMRRTVEAVIVNHADFIHFDMFKS